MSPRQAVLPRADDGPAVRQAGWDVIQIEAKALLELAETLEDGFIRAVEILVASKQRVIVSGMGKSGHIGRKVAATLASTGTPAFFVHPAEAAHGDLGMITAGDVLLLFSNSGSTPELSALVAHGRRLGCPIIAVASRTASPLMEAATVPLLLPSVPEACPVNIAPTTSTTMMLALGDALAIATMRSKGFNRETIKALHPGGSIGSQLLTVDEVMHVGDKLPVVAPDTPMPEVVIGMSTKGFGIVGVVADAHLVGVVTDGDLRRHIEDLFSRRADEVMTAAPKTVAEGTLCSDALAVMEEHRITALFVTACDDPTRPLGLVHIHDLARLGG